MSIREIADAVLARQVGIERVIDSLSHAERKLVRELLGEAPMPRNLTYDYVTQEWLI